MFVGAYGLQNLIPSAFFYTTHDGLLIHPKKFVSSNTKHIKCDMVLYKETKKIKGVET